MSAEAGRGGGRRPDLVPVTATEAVDVLCQQGYAADFELVDGALRSDRGNSSWTIAEEIVERRYRFELSVRAFERSSVRAIPAIR